SIMRTKLTLAIGAALLAACGVDTSTPQEEKPFDYSQLQLTPQNTSPLVLVDNKKLGQHLKNGIRLQLKAGHIYNGGPVTAPGVGEAIDTSSGRSFSETNVHVDGVDEADIAKYDGKHWYVLTASHSHNGFPQEKPGFHIVAT